MKSPRMSMLIATWLVYLIGTVTATSSPADAYNQSSLVRSRATLPNPNFVSPHLSDAGALQYPQLPKHQSIPKAPEMSATALVFSPAEDITWNPYAALDSSRTFSPYWLLALLLPPFIPQVTGVGMVPEGAGLFVTPLFILPFVVAMAFFLLY